MSILRNQCPLDLKNSWAFKKEWNFTNKSQINHLSKYLCCKNSSDLSGRIWESCGLQVDTLGFWVEHLGVFVRLLELFLSMFQRYDSMYCSAWGACYHVCSAVVFRLVPVNVISTRMAVSQPSLALLLSLLLWWIFETFIKIIVFNRNQWA